MRTKDIQELLYKGKSLDDVNYDVMYSEVVAKAYYEGYIKKPFLATALEEEFLEIVMSDPAAKPHNWKEPSGTHWSPSLYATMAFYVKHPIECGKALNRFKPSVVGELITSYKGEDEFILELMHAEKLAFDHEYIAYSSKYFYVKKRIPELWEYVCWKNGVKADGAYDAIKKLWAIGGTRYKQHATDLWWHAVIGEFFTNEVAGKMPYGSIPYNPVTEKPISPKGLKWLASHVGGKGHDFDEAIGLPMLNLFRLFGNNIQAYQRLGTVDCFTIHDLGQFTLPSGKIDPIWGSVILSKPTLKPYLSNIREIEEVLGRPPRDHKEVVMILEGPLKDSIGFGQEWGVFLSKAEIADYNRLFECGGKSAEFLPQVRGEYNGLTIRKLNAHEKMGPLIGRLSGCCQHLHGAARDCAIKTYTDPTMGVYVVEDSRKQLVAQAFAYRTLCDSIVLDSVESRSIYEDKAADVATLIKMAFDDVVKRQTMCVRQVVIGNTSYGMTQDVAKQIKGALKSNLQEIRKLDYKDSNNWKVVAENLDVVVSAFAVNDWVDQIRDLDKDLHVNRPNDEYDWDDLEYDEEDED